MVDETVVVALLNSTTTGVACTPASGSNTYQTYFKRSDFGATAPGTYKVAVYFRTVDGNLETAPEATSASVTF
jgi:hypothetical protein